MSIMREVEVARAEVGDDYSIEVTVVDLVKGVTATVSLDHGEARELARQIAVALLGAERMIREDRDVATHGFDIDLDLGGLVAGEMNG
ncbi:hypothetical protein ACFVR6_03805 [Microbacterium sp. NPDC058021]|uniref:hypothetical protein n=1 Tax=Microbacterium sp. NPDC058021 TaxID=3346306 RepID=UPI0036DE6232